MSTKQAQFLHFAVQGAARPLAPRQLRHCLEGTLPTHFMIQQVFKCIFSLGPCAKLQTPHYLKSDTDPIPCWPLSRKDTPQ